MLYKYSERFIQRMIANGDSEEELRKFRCTILRNDDINPPLVVVQEVDGRSGVRIHPANIEIDTP